MNKGSMCETRALRKPKSRGEDNTEVDLLEMLCSTTTAWISLS
jgi:hypothetical protein